MALDRSGHYVAFVLCLTYVAIWYIIYKSDYLTGALLFGMAYLFDLRLRKHADQIKAMGSRDGYLEFIILLLLLQNLKDKTHRNSLLEARLEEIGTLHTEISELRATAESNAKLDSDRIKELSKKHIENERLTIDLVTAKNETTRSKEKACTDRKLANEKLFSMERHKRLAASRGADLQESEAGHSDGRLRSTSF
ncbi:hypothetical protein EG327_005566 [Venturia inaequalis]|uniref:Uncharacterized protein n=1 Tax=Venturia inaequalis TaxID=5025 RepID=A0A8H3V6A1_VENIN|nr:hypothetical protein EG327_005566 [Venturia inaequalis]